MVGIRSGGAMSKIWLVCGLAFGVLVGPVARAASFDPYGVWLRAESGTEFDFYNCANKLCARIVRLAKDDDANALGTVILRNAVKTGEEWRGDIYNLEDGKIYRGVVTLDKPGELKLKGCLLKFLCKSEIWKRAPDQSAATTPGGQPARPAPSPTPGPGH